MSDDRTHVGRLPADPPKVMRLLTGSIMVDALILREPAFGFQPPAAALTQIRVQAGAPL
jgi:hypothetical protein